ncbi:hypothetical protein [Legionella sp.]|uniref:hypothetical protein n=1 Tax=Legionella sp. TaxID=459 RepID=UPI000CA9C4EB|nr:hypothetical protein [Legionella sp.]PJE05945.1 MAG: hypothetical protein CK430_15175 [Legionella sp.]
MKARILLFAWLINTSAHALVSNKDLYSSENNACTTDKVIKELILASIQNQHEIHINNISALNKTKKIVESIKDPDPKKSIGEQFNPKEANAFSENSQRIGSMNMALLVESNYERDLMAISYLTKIVDDFYCYDKTPDIKSQDAFYFELLLAWRQAMQQGTNIENNIRNQCTLDYAFYNKEISHLKEMSKSSKEVIVSWKKVEKIMQKYNLKNFDYDQLTLDKLSYEDKHEVFMLREQVFLPWNKERLYVMDIMNIRHFAKISKIVRDSRQKDIFNSGGDIDAVGDTINKLIKTHQLNKEDQKMLSAWQVLNEKIPSEAMKTFKIMATAKHGKTAVQRQ